MSYVDSEVSHELSIQTSLLLVHRARAIQQRSARAAIPALNFYPVRLHEAALNPLQAGLAFHPPPCKSVTCFYIVSALVAAHK